MNKHYLGILRIFVFLFLLITADQVIGLFLRKLYFNQKYGKDFSLIYSFRDCKEDILIFGASQAQHNYDPRIISDSLKMSCYNAGQDGGHSILLFYAQIKVILDRYIPKIIVVDLGSYHELEYKIGNYHKLAILEPFYKVYPTLRPLILLRSPFEKFKLLSSIYPFNSKIISILRFNTNLDKGKQWMLKGFIPIKNKIMDPSSIESEKNDSSNKYLDNNIVISLENLIKLCKNKNVKLYFTISPIYQLELNQNSLPTKSQEKLLEIIGRENIQLINLMDNKTFRDNPYLFADQTHLNEQGAKKYSSLIGGTLKRVEVDKHQNTK
jgi:hypothetical protein